MRHVTIIVMSATTKRRHDYKLKNFSGAVEHRQTIKMQEVHFKYALERFADMGLTDTVKALNQVAIYGNTLEAMLCELLRNREDIKEILGAKMHQLAKKITSQCITAITQKGRIVICK